MTLGQTTPASTESALGAGSGERLVRGHPGPIVLPLVLPLSMAQRDKRSVSFPPELAKAIDEAATESGSTFSAWITESASRRQIGLCYHCLWRNVTSDRCRFPPSWLRRSTRLRRNPARPSARGSPSRPLVVRSDCATIVYGAT